MIYFPILVAVWQVVHSFIQFRSGQVRSGQGYDGGGGDAREVPFMILQSVHTMMPFEGPFPRIRITV